MISKKKLVILPYEQLLTVVVSDDIEELTKFTQKNDVDHTKFDYSNFGGAFFMNEFGESFIALRSDIGLSPGLIAHECKHVINGLYDRLRIKLDPINDEPECYLLTWMVDEVWKFYNKQF